MNRWIGKTAVVTGASSGIGAAIAIALVKEKINVVGLARRPQLIDDLREQIPDHLKSNLHSYKCDLSNESDIKTAFKWIDEKFGGIDILVNNAGTGKAGNIVDADNTDMLKEVIDINVLAVAYCTRETFQIMKRNNVDGHIVIINSVDGHHVPYLAGKTASIYNMYTPSKYAVTAMTEVLRQEFQLFKTKIKITSISPGMVRTSIMSPEEFKLFGSSLLNPEDVAEGVLYAIGTPPHVQVHELTIKPIGEEF